MELVLKSVDADHGCFMLRDEDGSLVPKAVRYRDGVERAEELAMSRTIVDLVIRTVRASWFPMCTRMNAILSIESLPNTIFVKRFASP